MIDVMYVMLRTLIGSILRNTLYFEHLFLYKYLSLHNGQRNIRLISLLSLASSLYVFLIQKGAILSLFSNG